MTFPREGDTNTGGRVWSSTPYQSADGTTGSVQGVWLAPDEEVVWTWSADGTYILGYTIIQKGLPVPPVEPKDKPDWTGKVGGE